MTEEQKKDWKFIRRRILYDILTEKRPPPKPKPSFTSKLKKFIGDHFLKIVKYGAGLSIIAIVLFILNLIVQAQN